ncbi:MAG: SDR family NAD(P)-dependent oxidoreductase [Anaerolineae bacterium]|nr:SDR family NAD(P)-dependent oxidoreductase [Anaerolineae bacterium]
METFLISGENEGIGFYVISQLLREGKQVAVLDINTGNLEQPKNEHKNSLVYFTCDIANKEVVNE